MKSRQEFLEISLPLILNAVGDINLPKSLDREALATDLYRAYAAYHFVLDAQPPTLEAAQHAIGSFSKEVKRFRLALRNLNHERSAVLHILALARRQTTAFNEPCMDSDDYDTLSTLYGGVFPIGKVANLIGGMDRTLSEIEMLITEYEKQERAFERGLSVEKTWRRLFDPDTRSIGADAYLCSKLLPEIYETHFGRKLGISRTNGTPDGPGIRFVECALTQFEILSAKTGRPLGREAIAAHLKGRKKAQSLPSLDDLVPLEWVEGGP